MPIRPDRLHFGDTVGLAAPASPPLDPNNIDRAVATVERLGFKAKLAPNIRKRWGFLAGSDQERAADVMSLFLDQQVKAIFCVRGGYGTARLLPLLNYNLIRVNAKIFVGYSDITSLHCALLAQANLLSFHGPMLNSDFVKGALPEFTMSSLLRTIMEPTPSGSIRKGYSDNGVTVLQPGKASGALLGGNLSIICAALGTPFEPSFKRRILFLEDIDEEPYRFDRMLTQLLNAGLLQQLAGIAIGVNKNCDDPKAKKSKEFRQKLIDVFKERLLHLKIPVVAGLPFGHIPNNSTLPVGGRATLNGDTGDLSIIEAAVR